MLCSLDTTVCDMHTSLNNGQALDQDSEFDFWLVERRGIAINMYQVRVILGGLTMRWSGQN